MHRIITVLDNFDALKDAGFSDEFEKVINMLSREGVGLGLHLIIGASRSAAMKYQLIANIKEKVTFFQLDPGEIPGIMGRTQMKLPEIPGRGLVKLDELYEFQAAVPTEETSPSERIKSLRAEAKEMRDRWNGELPAGIPVVPEVLTMEAFKAYPSVKRVMETPHMAAVGLDLEKVEAVTIDFGKTPLVTLAANTMKKDIILETIIATLKPENIIIFGSDNTKHYQRQATQFINIDTETWGEETRQFVTQQEEQLQNKVASNKDLIVIFPDITRYIETLSGDGSGRMANVLNKASQINMKVICALEERNYGRGMTELAHYIRTANVVISGSKMIDVSQVEVLNKPPRERDMLPNEANIVQNKQLQRIRIIDIQ